VENNILSLRSFSKPSPDQRDPESAVKQCAAYALADIGLFDDEALRIELANLKISDEEAFAPPPLPPNWADRVCHAVNASTPLVPRSEIVARILDALEASSEIVLTGAAGSGKTTLIQRFVIDSFVARRRFPRMVRLDCAALRMEDPFQFSKNAAWAVFGPEEDGYRAFIGECEQRGRLDPFLTWLEYCLGAGAVLFLDHVEHISRSEGIVNWLINSLIATARRVGVKLCFCDRTLSGFDKFNGLFVSLRASAIEVPNFDCRELEEWLHKPYFHNAPNFEITAGEVLRVTGGSPRLVRDLANFFVLLQNYDRIALSKFQEWRPQEYVAHCERLIWAKRMLPLLLFKDVEDLSLDEVSPEERGSIRETLCATGVVTEEGGRFKYVSPIHRTRARQLGRPEVLSLALLRASSQSALESRSHPIRLRHVGEIAVDPLIQFLGTQRSPRFALLSLQQVLHSWGFRATIYLRDRNNARLLLQLNRHGEDELFPLEDPDFIRAVQSGRSTIAHGLDSSAGELLVPIIGLTGAVEMLLKGPFCSAKASTYLAEIRRDRFVNLLRGLKPTLSQILERFWAARDRTTREKLLHRSNDPARTSMWQNVVEALCNGQPVALAVLRRRQGGWVVDSFERLGKMLGNDIGLFRTRDWVQPQHVDRLDSIAFHPSKRGLVLNSRDRTLIFPKLIGQKDATVYARPVWFKSECRLVVFMFKNTPAGGLDGSMQHQLSIAAHAIAAAS